MESINTTAYTLMKNTEKPPESDESSKHVDLITGVVAGVVVLIVIIVFAVRLSRRARSYPAVSEQTKKASRKMRRRLKSNTQEDKRANYKNILEMDAVSTAGQEQAAPSYANVCNSLIAFPRDQLTIVKEIGHGSFGLVFLAEANGIIERSKVTKVAVKTLKDEANNLQRRDMLRELELMKKLPDHPNVVKLLGFCVDQDPLYIIVEYLTRGNLKNLLKQSRSKGGRVYRNLHGISKSLASTDLIMFAKDTADGMEFISSQKCIHRDLAARNVLVADDMTCKVSDFGLARDVMNIRVYERESESALPMRWMAIESILDDVYTTESDVWSFGVLLWEIATLGARPYPAMSAKVLISELQNGFRMPKPQHCQDELYEMMLRCWNEDPASRPSFKMISDDLDRLICEGKDYLSIEDIEDAVYEVSLPGGTLERL
ncbi:tyrosine kinase receptor Cad96Ca-like [Acanthaster planci]|uniref:receptor protein-tyrosine kinase n=1 Tax=Acanthaster planci TaxID=133434 RepID=A0A8B7ZYH7_ACAPL|nr:tyrosine kinase receptor Cad96Ca-like [Acanthaster planci]